MVDVSGSMHGFPLDISKAPAQGTCSDESCGQTDAFNVLLFSGRQRRSPSESLPATPENLDRHSSSSAEQQGGGGTELLAAIKRALAADSPRRGVLAYFCVLTDGSPRHRARAVRLHRREPRGRQLFAFGIGTGVNRFIIEGLAGPASAQPFVDQKPDAAPAPADEVPRVRPDRRCSTDIELSDFDGLEASMSEPASTPRPVGRAADNHHREVDGSRTVPHGDRARSSAGAYLQGSILPDRGGRVPAGRGERGLPRPLGADSGSPASRTSTRDSLRPGDQHGRGVTALGLKYSLLTGLHVVHRGGREDPEPRWPASRTVEQPFAAAAARV